MADRDSKEICEHCKFWEYTGHAGECRRFPTAIVKYQTHWCGEFSGKFAVAPLTSPAEVIFTEEVKLLTDEQVNELFKDIVSKKRGRPAKNAQTS